MRTLTTLIKLQKNKADDCRKRLAEIQALEDRLNDELRRLAAELASEQKAATGDIVVSITFPAYARQAKLRRENLESSLAQIAQQRRAAEDALAEAFQELKRFELVEENRVNRVKAERARRETQAFDEIAATRHQRGKDEE